jgi:chromosomal replication initiation ATPase DnaA
VIGDCNREALAAVEGWRDWVGRRLAICGPPGCGKSHLTAIWAAESGAQGIDAATLQREDIRAIAALRHVIVEDVDHRLAAAPDRPAAEEALLHLFNVMAEEEGFILFTGREAPARWEVALPDLASRLTLPAVFTVGRPDDTLLSHLIVKLFADRGVVLEPRVAAFLSLRVGRSFGAVHDMVDALDRYAMGVQRPVTVGLTKEVFGW